MRRHSARLFQDTIVVYDRTWTEGVANDPKPSDSEGVTLAASVQRVTQSSHLTDREAAPGGVPFGCTKYNVLTQSDPGVTVTSQLIYWTADQFGTFATPIVLSANGASEPPSGRCSRWTVSVMRRS
jgi:hypothetical protein